MRRALDRTLADPDFLAEVRRANIPVAPMAGAAMKQYVDAIMAAPAQQIDAARRLHEDLIRTAR